MPDLFIKLVESIGDPDPLSVWIFGLALIALLFLRVPKLRHRRYRMGVVFLLLPLLSTITLFIQDTIGLFAAGALIGIVGVPVAWWLFTTAMRRDALLFEKAMIRSLRDLVHAGDFSRATRRSTQKQWFLLSVPAKLKWSFLKAKAHSDQGEFREAYAIYDQLLSLPLFQEERIEVQLQQIYSLCALGDTLRATKTFDSIDGAISSGYYRYWARALLAERAGELEAARTNWLHAVGEDVPASAKLAKGYNNLGRIEGILRNRAQALHFYTKAASLVSDSQDRTVLHSVYPNLIDTLLLSGEREKAASALEEYSALVDQTIIEGLVELYNYRLQYARQTGDRARLVRTLRDGQTRIVPRLSSEQRLIFQACELRIRFNADVGFVRTLRTVIIELDDYFDLGFPQEYGSLKEVFLVLKELTRHGLPVPSREAFSHLVRYMRDVDDRIRDYLVELPDYCVFERCYWEKERAWLLKLRKEPGSKEQYQDLLKHVLTHLDNVKDIHLQHGNPLEAIEADLNIADEAMSEIVLICDSEIAGWLQSIVAQRVDQAIQAVQPFANHPKTWEYHLRIARYALFLGDGAVARSHFEAFEGADVSVDHYARWLQDYYRELKGAFGRAQPEA